MIRVVFRDGTQRHYYDTVVEDNKFLTGFDSETNLYTVMPIRNIIIWVDLSRKGNPKK